MRDKVASKVSSASSKASTPTAAEPRDTFHPDYDWTSTCPHDGEDACPDGDDGCRCECHAVPER